MGIGFKNEIERIYSIYIWIRSTWLYFKKIGFIKRRIYKLSTIKLEWLKKNARNEIIAIRKLWTKKEEQLIDLSFIRIKSFSLKKFDRSLKEMVLLDRRNVEDVKRNVEIYWK